MSVRSSAKFVCTKTWERIEIIALHFLKVAYPKFRPDRTKTYELKAEWNPINEIDPDFFCFKDVH